MMTAVLLAGCGASLTETPNALTTTGSNEPQKVVGNDSGTAASFASTSPIAPATTSAPSTTSALAEPEAKKAARELTASSTPGNSAYKIGPLDVLEVSVFKVPDLSKTVQVADSGTVNLPLVGEIPAAGLTAQQVEHDLTKKLGAKYLQNPQVTVFVKEYNSQRVTIEGAVKKPGVYPIRGQSTLLQMIATAEGVTEVAENEVAIFREVDGKRQAAKFNLPDLRSGQSPDPVLQKGDTIVINDSALAKGYQNLLKALPIGTFIALL